MELYQKGEYCRIFFIVAIEHIEFEYQDSICPLDMIGGNNP